MIDNNPRKLSGEQIEGLRILSRQVVQLLELRRKTALLENQNARLAKFTEEVAGDLQSPMRRIGLFAETLLNVYSDRLDVEGIDLLKHLNTSTAKLQQMIKELLDDRT